MKQIGFGLLMLLTLPAAASYQCNVNLQHDVEVTSQWVRISDDKNELTILPSGEVKRQGQALSLNSEQQQQAKDYQASLRHELPLLEQQAQDKLVQVHQALDKIIVTEMGQDSKVRQHLDHLSTELKQELSKVLEKKSEQHIIFHHQRVARVEAKAKKKVEQVMGAAIKDSINEMGRRALSGKEGNSLKSMLGGVGNLQQSVRGEWKIQRKEVKRFAKDVCQRVGTLEQQQANLVEQLP